MPTKEELATVRPPNDVLQEIAKVVEITGLPKEKVKSAFYKALALKALDSVTNMDERCRQAMYIMIAQFKAKMPSENATLIPMEFTVFATTAPKSIPLNVKKIDPVSGKEITVKEPKNVANVYGVFMGAPNPDPNMPELPAKLGFLSLWEDACQLLSQLKKGGSYRVSLGVTAKEDHYDLKLSNVVKVERLQVELPPAKDIITKYYTPIRVSEIPNNPGKNRLIHGRIVRFFTKLDKNGQNRGYILMADPLVGAALLVAPTSGEKREYQVMWSTPEFATEYGEGTECYFMASIDNKSEQYGISVYGDFIVPITISTLDLEAASVWDDDPFDYSDDTPAATSSPSEDHQSAPSPAVAAPINSDVPSPAANGEW